MLERFVPQRGRKRSAVAQARLYKDGTLRLNATAMRLGQFQAPRQHIEVLADRMTYAMELVPVPERTAYSLSLSFGKADCGRFGSSAIFRRWLEWDVSKLVGAYRVYPRDDGGGLRVEFLASRRLDLRQGGASEKALPVAGASEVRAQRVANT